MKPSNKQIEFELALYNYIEERYEILKDIDLVRDEMLYIADCMVDDFISDNNLEVSDE